MKSPQSFLSSEKSSPLEDFAAGEVRDRVTSCLADDPPAVATGGGSTPWPGDAAGDDPLNIVYVTPCLWPGGTEFWLLALLRFLDPARARVVRCVVTAPELIHPEFVKTVPVPVEPGGADAVRRAAAGCDLLMTWGVPELAAWLGDRPRPPCVFVAHGEDAWTRDVLEQNAPAVDHVVAVSDRARERVCEGFPTTTIHNGIDAARLARTRSRDDMRAALGFTPDDFVIGYLGRLSPEKRPQTLIRAVAQLPANFKALMVGYGSLRPPLLDLANDRIPGRYAFARAIDYLGDYYQAMDAFCLPSEEEGFGLVLLEAMMCGLPTIAAPVGFVPEVLVNRVNGLVVPGTPDSIAAAARLLHRHPSWARGLAAEGRAYAETHGHARRMARAYEHLFKSLVRSGPPVSSEPIMAATS